MDKAASGASAVSRLMSNFGALALVYFFLTKVIDSTQLQTSSPSISVHILEVPFCRSYLPLAIYGSLVLIVVNISNYERDEKTNIFYLQIGVLYISVWLTLHRYLEANSLR